MADIKDKIAKLLALAQSSNENEAKAALLKARALMAEHKLTESDCVEAAQRQVREIRTEWTFSKRRDVWASRLAIVIADHYCCTSLLSRDYGKKTYSAVFIGLDGDVEVCVEVFGYAMRCVTERVKTIRKEMKGLPIDYVISECDDYGYGFAAGLKDAFQRQQGEHQEWGLVMVKPQEVIDATQGLKKGKFYTHGSGSGRAYSDGFSDGGKFVPEKSLKAV